MATLIYWYINCCQLLRWRYQLSTSVLTSSAVNCCAVVICCQLLRWRYQLSTSMLTSSAVNCCAGVISALNCCAGVVSAVNCLLCWRYIRSQLLRCRYVCSKLLCWRYICCQLLCCRYICSQLLRCGYVCCQLLCRRYIQQTTLLLQLYASLLPLSVEKYKYLIFFCYSHVADCIL